MKKEKIKEIEEGKREGEIEQEEEEEDETAPFYTNGIL